MIETGRAATPGLSLWRRRAIVVLALASIAAPARASDDRPDKDLDALLPVGATACFVGRFSDPLVARLRLHRLEATLSSNPDETGPGRGVLAIVDLTPQPGMAPEAGTAPAGSRADAPLAGRAYCSASRKLGAISCSDDSGCDRADRLLLERTPGGARLTFRGPFSFAGSACGGADDEELPGVELPDPRARTGSFDLASRPIDECR